MENDETASDLDRRVAARLKNLRAQRGLTLDELAKRSGVSRSMISFIERAESSPTARVLDKLAASLGVSLAALFADEERIDAAPVSRRADQLRWCDPETGYVRRTLSPLGFPSPLNLVEVVLPPHTRVAYDSGPRAAAVYHQIWVIKGSVKVTRGDDRYVLATGDCLALQIEGPIAYHNAGAGAARYIIATTTDAIPLTPGCSPDKTSLMPQSTITT